MSIVNTGKLFRLLGAYLAAALGVWVLGRIIGTDVLGTMALALVLVGSYLAGFFFSEGRIVENVE